MPWIIAGYPLLAHLAVWLHSRPFQYAALVWLLLIALWEPLKHRRAWAWVTLVGGVVCLYALMLIGGGLFVLYLPPIMIPVAMFILFARSLRGDTPLVTRMATAIRGEPLPEPLIAYTRNVTVMWCFVSAALIVSAVTTALWASPEFWSLTTNILHYVILGAVFLFEFAYRKMKYGALEPWGFFEFIRRLSRIRMRI